MEARYRPPNFAGHSPIVNGIVAARDRSDEPEVVGERYLAEVALLVLPCVLVQRHRSERCHRPLHLRQVDRSTTLRHQPATELTSAASLSFTASRSSDRGAGLEGEDFPVAEGVGEQRGALKCPAKSACASSRAPRRPRSRRPVPRSGAPFLSAPRCASCRPELLTPGLGTGRPRRVAPRPGSRGQPTP